MNSFPLRLPDVLKEPAAEPAEAGCCFAARAARAMPGRAREALARSGEGNPPRPGDGLGVGDGQA